MIQTLSSPNRRLHPAQERPGAQRYGINLANQALAAEIALGHIPSDGRYVTKCDHLELLALTSDTRSLSMNATQDVLHRVPSSWQEAPVPTTEQGVLGDFGADTAPAEVGALAVPVFPLASDYFTMDNETSQHYWTMIRGYLKDL
jgi:hypothetical protein